MLACCGPEISVSWLPDFAWSLVLTFVCPSFAIIGMRINAILRKQIEVQQSGSRIYDLIIPTSTSLLFPPSVSNVGKNIYMKCIFIQQGIVLIGR